MHDHYTQIAYTKFVSLWHKDPEHHGDDDSCGWFLRSYHGDKATFEKVVKEFEFNFKHNYWFNEDGTCVFSTQGIVLCMYRTAGWIVFKYKNRDRYNRFINKHLANILHFAENPTDSLHRAITSEMYYRTVEHDRSIVESREDRIRHLASVIYGDIIRKMRPWYKHPRWHVHHWRITIHWWTIIALLAIVSGCGPKFHLRQAKKHILKAESLGAQWTNDTVYINTRVPVPEIRVDSLIISKPGDTVIISEDRLQVKYVRLDGDTVFIDAACLPDTIIVNVPVTVTKVIDDPKKLKWWWFLIVLAVGFVVGMFVQRR